MELVKKYWKKILTGLLAVLFVLVTLQMSGEFYTTYDSLIGFTPSNFSNSITADKPVRIKFQISEDHFDRCYLRFSANTEACLNTSLRIALFGQDGTLLVEEIFDGAQLYGGKYVNLSPARSVPKGEACMLVIESDAAQEDEAYRLLIGSAVTTDVTVWYCGELQEVIPEKPELHVVYPEHFGVRTFVVYLAFLLVAFGALLLPRTAWWDNSRGWISLGWLLAAPVVLLYFLEMLCMGSVLNLTPRLLVCNALLFLGAELVVLAISGRTHIAVFAGILISAVAGVSSHFVMMYRGTAINPADLFAITAAADVVAHYSFALDLPLLLALAGWLMLGGVAIRYRTVLSLRRKPQAALRGGALAAGAAVLVFCCTGWSAQWSDVKLNLKYNTDSALRNGMLYNFVQTMPMLKIQPPEDYDRQQALTAAQTYIEQQAWDGQAPDIILIMSETWADYTKLADLSHLSEDAQPYYHSLENDSDLRTLTGSAIVPVYGSGTCNSEFEAVTGFSMRNFSATCFPYLQYVVAGTPSLASYLSTLGYTTTALHPGIADTWHRDSVYPSLGFDNMMFDEAFPYQEMRNELISDKACFDTILSVLPQEETAAPAFVLNVTIQNHGGFKVRDDFDRIITSTQQDPLFEESELYHSLLRYSDNALQELISQLEQRTRPTLLIMFGDHQPSLSSEYLSYIHYDSAVATDPLAQYTTPYLIWANYDLPQDQVPQTLSTNYLGAVALELAGLPKNGWYEFLYQQMQIAPVYSVLDIRDRDGVSMDPEDPRLAEYDDFQYGGLRGSDEYPKGFF